MKFAEFAKYLNNLEKTTSRIKMTEDLAGLFRKAGKEEIDKVVYLSLGILAPSYRGVVFNIAERMILQIIASSNSKDLAKVKNLYKQKGDLGDVAGSLSKNRGKKLNVNQVYQRLYKIAVDEGTGSQERKIKEASKLLSDLDPLSSKFVARILMGKLRLGFSDKTILDALSWMRHGDKSAKANLERAYHVLPDVGLIAKHVKIKGIKKATRAIKPIIGVPVLPMLAQRLKSPAEMIKKMQEVAVEPKFDGLRIQLHFKSGKKGFVKAYTRNLNENSWMFPELKEMSEFINAREVILDSEAMGVDEQRKTLANFQTTMTRRRKHQIHKIAKKISIKFFVFDILSNNGKSLMDEPYKKRRKQLEKVVNDGKLFQVVDYIITKDPKVIEKEMIKELSEGMEGIIVKKADSKYVPGRTGWRWVKMKEKESSVAKLADTLDCIVMGYSVGKGKRAQFGVGQFLVGVRDKAKIKTITKTGTGITDAQLRELKERLAKLEVEKKPEKYQVHKDLEPDFWVTPSQVVEIAADEITKSPKHSSGYALRFPRLVKFRDDKSASQATAITEVKKLFNL